MSGWEATDFALVILAVFAPTALVTLVAMLRGYSVKVRLTRPAKPPAAPSSDSDG